MVLSCSSCVSGVGIHLLVRRVPPAGTKRHVQGTLQALGCLQVTPEMCLSYLFLIS